MCRPVLFLFLVLAATALAESPVPTTTTGTIYLGPHDGRTVEFSGPDDLHLDPATNVIAVDVYGDQDREVNGVRFITDGRSAGFGTATNHANGVSVTTTAANFIDNWSAAPAFTGADQSSANNLAEIMRDLRYEDAPGPVRIDIEGLAPGVFYELQLLINEGADRSRHFDIAVEDELVLDNWTSEGEAPDENGNGGQVWTARNSFAYVGNFRAPADGELNIVMQHQIGGQGERGTDLNLGYQALILHRLPPRKVQILELNRAGTDLVFKWESVNGKLYDLRSESNPAATDPLAWPVFEGRAGLAATPPLNTLTIPLPADSFRLFVIEEINAPPVSLLSEDFESGQGGWTSGTDGDAGTAWELGTPLDVGPPAANSGTNCFGTNISADYGNNANIWLRSPPLDLTATSEATLRFSQYVDIEPGFDLGRVVVLDAADDSELAVVVSPIDGFPEGWQPVIRAIPPAGVCKVIKLEFRFQCDNFTSLAGWYIDDIEVTVP